MEGDHIKIHEWLLPVSWLYGLGVFIRNTLFDIGLKRSKSYDVPVISVGNLTVGGSGKTPHTEYLITLLQEKYQIAILSRGYKRKSRGFVMADDNTTMREIGDEPYQMKCKFPKAHIAVDKKRCHGIEMLIRKEVEPATDIIILDDAYQHRYVTPGINILLMDYHRLIYYDKLLPAGRLREPISEKRRADIIIVTKCPEYITPMDKRGIERSLELDYNQKLFFTTFKYGIPYQLYSKTKRELFSFNGGKIFLLTGIASPQQMEYDLRKIIPDFDIISYPDHHNFSSSDIKYIRERTKGSIVITTEKDASRLTGLGKEALGEELAESIYVLPIEVKFMGDNQEQFDHIITSYVQKNSRKSTLLRKK